MTTGWGMVDDTGRDDADTSDEMEEDLPYYTPPFGREEVPGFLDRLVAHLLAGETREAFTFEGWRSRSRRGLAAPARRLRPRRRRVAAAEPARGPRGPRGRIRRLRGGVDGGRAPDAARSVGRADGPEAVARGENQDPEGILDVVLVSVGIPEAEMWDRGDLYCVLVTNWDAEPRQSMLRQAMVVLPREYAVGSLSALLPEEDMHNDLLMNGEHPLELRRRAWLLSTLFGAGEVRLRDVDVPASRFSLQSRSGVTTVWTFTDDGRILVLIQDPTSTFADEAPAQFLAEVAQQHGGEAADVVDSSEREADLAEAWLILAARMLDRVPDDLRALVAARGEDARGAVAEHDLEFRMLGDEPVPVITGAVWFDGAHWCVSPSLMEIGRRNDFGMDDFGFGAAVRQPYRLGARSPSTRCPGRATSGAPGSSRSSPRARTRSRTARPTRTASATRYRRAATITTSWRTSSASPERGGSARRRTPTGRIGRSRSADAGSATTTVGRSASCSPRGALDGRCTPGLGRRPHPHHGRTVGSGGEIHARNEKTGIDRRSPLTRVMRATGLLTAPLWWVNGHAVAVVAGTPDPSYGDDPEVIIVIARPDAVLDLARGAVPGSSASAPGSSPTSPPSWAAPPRPNPCRGTARRSRAPPSSPMRCAAASAPATTSGRGTSRTTGAASSCPIKRVPTPRRDPSPPSRNSSPCSAGCPMTCCRSWWTETREGSSRSCIARLRPQAPLRPAASSPARRPCPPCTPCSGGMTSTGAPRKDAATGALCPRPGRRGHDEPFGNHLRRSPGVPQLQWALRMGTAWGRRPCWMRRTRASSSIGCPSGRRSSRSTRASGCSRSRTHGHAQRSPRRRRRCSGIPVPPRRRAQ